MQNTFYSLPMRDMRTVLILVDFIGSEGDICSSDGHILYTTYNTSIQDMISSKDRPTNAVNLIDGEMGVEKDLDLCILVKTSTIEIYRD